MGVGGSVMLTVNGRHVFMIQAVAARNADISIQPCSSAEFVNGFLIYYISVSQDNVVR